MSRLLFDPQAIPVTRYAGEAAVAPDLLQADWLRSRFAAPAPLWTPEDRDQSWFPRRDEPTPAAVLIPLVQRPEGLHVLLTQRTAHLNDHAGQISFPGGRAEAEDADPIATALRETEEEIGLARQHIEVLGTLPDYFTGTGYRVTPVAGLVTPPFALQADSFEVAEIFEVPLAFLMDGARHEVRTVTLPDGSGTRSFYAMPFGDYFIWGATAGMLRNLFHFLRAGAV